MEKIQHQKKGSSTGVVAVRMTLLKKEEGEGREKEPKPKPKLRERLMEA